jgi:exodeoxyribonuclease VIII
MEIQMADTIVMNIGIGKNKMENKKTIERNPMNYFEKDAISATLLKAIIKQSPVHAEERMKNFKATPTMKLGTAFHAKVLESTEYDDLIAVSPDCDKRTKAGKEIHAKFLETVGDKTVITQEQSLLVDRMSEACMAHPQVQALVEKCHETEIEIDFEFDSMDCKAKIDMADEEGTIVDFKTCQDASPEAFMRASANFSYHLQLAWYARAMGLKWHEVNAYIVAVENTAPHGVAVYKFSKNAMLNGWELCKVGVGMWKEHKMNLAIGDGTFPYTDEVLELELPVWATNMNEG